MRLFRQVRLRFRSLMRRSSVERELDKEIAFHIEEQVAEYRSQGMSEAEAHTAARRVFGGVTSIEERCRDERRVSWLDDFIQDSRFAIRSFGKARAFTTVAAATLALGIGANTAIFSLAYSILFRPLPYPNPERLVVVDGGVGGVGPVTSLRQISKEVDYAGYFANHQVTLQTAGGAERIRGAVATANLAGVLGMAPVRGRWFAAGEEVSGRHRVMVLSYRMWSQRFGQDPDILGRRLNVNEEPFEVIGVMAPGFAFPSPETEFWVPLRMDPKNIGYVWGNTNLLALGRLRPQASVASAKSELGPAIDRVREMFPWRMPDEWGLSATLELYQSSLTNSIHAKLLTLSGAAALLFLIACANVANLLLARGIHRQREFTMREALGAGRGRLLRQLLAENVLLAALGGSAGLVLAVIILRSLPHLLPADTPRLHEAVVPDGSFVTLAALGALLTVALFSLAPLFRHQPGLVRSSGIDRRASGLSLALIAGELAVVTMLVVGAGLMIRTLWQLSHVDVGIRGEGVVTARLAAGPNRCGKAERCWSLLQDLNQTLLGIPGVRSVNWSNFAPLDKEQSAMSVAIEDHPRPEGAPAFSLWLVPATPGYFKALGIRLLEGRTFTNSDRLGASPVLIVSASTARRFWPGQSALGKRIRPVWLKQWSTVVGVVSDVSQHSLTGFPSWVDGVEYGPLAQMLPEIAQSVQITLFVQSTQPDFVKQSLAKVIRGHYPDIAVSRILSLNEVRGESVADQRSTTWLLLLFASLGLLLGMAGVHGVVSHRATQRTREIGIRMALGATQAGIAGLILKETLFVALTGGAAGLAGAYAGSRLLRSLLFGVTAHDPIAFALGPLALLAAAAAGAAIPGLRAARTDPAVTLRSE